MNSILLANPLGPSVFDECDLGRLCLYFLFLCHGLKGERAVTVKKENGEKLKSIGSQQSVLLLQVLSHLVWSKSILIQVMTYVFNV